MVRETTVESNRFVLLFTGFLKKQRIKALKDATYRVEWSRFQIDIPE